MISRRLLVAGLIVAVVAAGAAHGQPAQDAGTHWKVRSLGALAGLEMAPVAINDRGEIVGSGYGAGVAGRAFLWRDGKLTDLGRCGGYSKAVAINRFSEAVGSCGLRPDGKPDHAFLWRNGRAIDLGTLGWSSSDAVAINDRGEIVGNRYSGSAEHAFLWRDGKMRDLGTLGGTRSEATAINNGGEIVGDSTTASGEQHAFLWRSGRMVDLGTFGGAISARFGGIRGEQFEPRAINAHGTIVGLVHDPLGSYETAFRWRSGHLSSFGGLGGQPSRAIALNERGQVLVRTTPPTDKRGAAYLWQRGKLRRLPALNPRRPATFATALNASGDVVGTSLVAIGDMRPFVWAGGRMNALPTPSGRTGAPFVSAAALNNRGQIVGSDGSHLLLWTR